MFDDLGAYFVNNLMLAYESYATARDGKTVGRNKHLSSGLALANALFHFREHLSAEHEMSRAVVEAECPDYRLIADVANVSKHKRIDRRSPLVASTEDIQEFAVITRFADSEGEYSDIRSAVQVRCTDGKIRSLDEALPTVLNFWGNKLQGWGLLKFKPRDEWARPGSRYLSRQEAQQLDLEAVHGIRFLQSMQLQRYNPAKGFAEPIDLTGAEIQFRIYRPAYEAQLEFTDRNTGRRHGVKLPLSETESEKMLKLATDEERSAYIANLVACRRDEVQKLLWEAGTAESEPETQ